MHTIFQTRPIRLREDTYGTIYECIERREILIDDNGERTLVRRVVVAPPSTTAFTETRDGKFRDDDSKNRFFTEVGG
ncbi:MAG: hypothetical protein AB7G13_05300 [Lautropia sp.]